MKQPIKKVVDLPFVVGQSYITKMATKDRVTLVEDPYIYKDGIIIGTKNIVNVIYENCMHLGKCGLAIERLIPHKETITIEIDVCDLCGKPL